MNEEVKASDFSDKQIRGSLRLCRPGTGQTEALIYAGELLSLKKN